MSTFPPYQPPAPDLPLSKRFAEDPDEATELVADVRARLDEGETLLCVLAVARSSRRWTTSRSPTGAWSPVGAPT